MSKGDDGLDTIVASERSLHPDRYSQIESYQKVSLIVTALANMHEIEHSDGVEDLHERAQLYARRTIPHVFYRESHIRHAPN